MLFLFSGLQDPGAIVEAMEDDIENQIADIANTVANMMREHLAERLFAIPQNLKEDMSCVSTVRLCCYQWYPCQG